MGADAAGGAAATTLAEVRVWPWENAVKCRRDSFNLISDCHEMDRICQDKLGTDILVLSIVGEHDGALTTRWRFPQALGIVDPEESDLYRL